MLPRCLNIGSMRPPVYPSAWLHPAFYSSSLFAFTRYQNEFASEMLSDPLGSQA